MVKEGAKHQRRHQGLYEDSDAHEDIVDLALDERGEDGFGEDQSAAVRFSQAKFLIYVRVVEGF